MVALLFLAKNSGGRLIGTTMALLILQPSDRTAGQLIDTYGPLTKWNLLLKMMTKAKQFKSSLAAG